jgi:tetratricopeptide (TPR) repeat protein
VPLLILLGTLALAGPSPQREAAIERLNEGVAHYDKHELDAAEAAITEAIELDQDLAEARLSLGRIWLQRRAYGNARGVLISGLTGPGLTPAMRVELGYALGRAHTELGHEDDLPMQERRSELREALSAFTDVIAIEPRHFRAHYWRGEALDALDDPEQADAAYRKCIAIEPRYSACWIALGNMNIDYGFHALGLAVLEAGVEVNRDDAQLWNGLGRARMALGEPARAVVAFEKATAIDPKLVDALFGLGRAYAEVGRRAEAIDRLEAFHARAGADVPEHYKRAAQDMIERLQDR